EPPGRRSRGVRILRLNLLAFGPFTGETLDFSENAHGLQMVYGPNEAGKSSTLRALRQWLYGIPPISPDAFLPAKESLRIGGVLESAEGAQLEFIRRKGQTKTLRGPDDTAVFDEPRLMELLAGVNATMFDQRYGINHLELRRGGEAVARGKG